MECLEKDGASAVGVWIGRADEGYEIKDVADMNDAVGCAVKVKAHELRLQLKKLHEGNNKKDEE